MRRFPFILKAALGSSVILTGLLSGGDAILAAAPRAGLQIAQATAAPTFDDSYLLGPGDLITISVFNVPEYSGDQQVMASGAVNLPAVGQLSVNGLTITQAEQAISTRYQSELRYPQIRINLVKPRPMRIAVTGEIQSPGLYTLAADDSGRFPSLAAAIQQAGGLTQAADLERIQIRRQRPDGQVQQVVSNLGALLNGGDLSQDVALRDGDSIVIAQAEEIDLRTSDQIASSNLAASAEEPISVAVVGEVFTPGIYNYASRSTSAPAPAGDSSASVVQQPGRLTVTRALQLAGGVRPSADLREIEVKRTTRFGDSRTISLNLWQLVESGDNSQDLILQEGDTITVPTATAPTASEIAQLTETNLLSNITVNIVGEVESPGPVVVAPNTTLNQAVLAAGGFNRRARQTVELIRLNPNGTVSQQEIKIDLSEGLDPEENPIMRHNDVIVVNRNGAARFSDGIDTFVRPFLNILPFRF